MMVVVMLVLADATDVMMVSDLWLAHGLLEAWQPHTVLAQLAVHVRAALDRLVGSLGESTEKERMHVEVAGA
jgi:hypothetical protein